MSKRHRDALVIWESGAVNVRAIATAIAAACAEVRAEQKDRPEDDAAVRLMTAQLASLCRVDSSGDLLGDAMTVERALVICRSWAGKATS